MATKLERRPVKVKASRRPEDLDEVEEEVTAEGRRARPRKALVTGDARRKATAAKALKKGAKAATTKAATEVRRAQARVADELAEEAGAEARRRRDTPTGVGGGKSGAGGKPGALGQRGDAGKRSVARGGRRDEPRR